MRPLSAVSDDPAARARLADLAERVAQASDCGEVQALLHLATVTLGAQRSFFASISGEGRDRSYAFVLDCDPGWWHRYRATAPLPRNPWLAYAERHSMPIRVTQLRPWPSEDRGAPNLPADEGFESAVLVPAHSGQADHRASVLCLGHSATGYFEDRAFAKLQVGVRSFAMELHDWWTRHEQQQLAQRTRLSDADVRLLERHCAGLSSKQIANELHVSRASINSRFQRIGARLGVRNRRAAARVAVECGLLIM